MMNVDHFITAKTANSKLILFIRSSALSFTFILKYFLIVGSAVS